MESGSTPKRLGGEIAEAEQIRVPGRPDRFAQPHQKQQRSLEDEAFRVW
jgi:hypothetical protein